jgi:hypothetical protein
MRATKSSSGARRGDRLFEIGEIGIDGSNSD